MQIKNELGFPLLQAQAALADGVSEVARRWLATFIQQAVNRSNLPAPPPYRLERSHANQLTCGAANVLLNVPSPQ